MEASILVKVVLPLSLFIIMLGMGLALKPVDFKMVMVRPKAVALGLVAQMLMLPILAYLIVLAFGMTGAVAVGVMILALCPGGTTSNLYTYLAKGDIALSVTLTSLVSLIAPFTVPLMIVMFMSMLMGQEEYIHLPVLKTIIQLVVITILPISIGMYIHNKKPQWAQKADKPVKVFSILFLFLIVAMIVFNNLHNMAEYFAKAGLAAIILNIASMVLGYILAKVAQLNEAQSKAIGIEVGFQNGTLAIVIALTLLENTEMAIAATCYSLSMFVTGAVFAMVLANRSKKAVETTAEA
ncbi:bile acid:sodium symporter family protein [Bermanella sp. WJH001]|uniref:bile acid:sodium symporter family protein n=1 Tax=Bermanella sp. WJH001 TaxID=3048005 RepID=UPI0024BE616F|nr:bile acid:sodium symporter family protein [Bermanella sp. WJH001]MDJ1538278.1 bile acid:sodium symporter family protein [Bermanella sp. WJH001]